MFCKFSWGCSTSAFYLGLSGCFSWEGAMLGHMP